MRNIVAAVVVGIGTLSATPAQASWLSEALRNTDVNVNIGPSYGYGRGYYVQPVYVAPPVCGYVQPPVYVVPSCGPTYRPYGGNYHHNHHDRYDYRGRDDRHGHRHNHRH